MPMTTHTTPYLAVHDGTAAPSFYSSAFGAIEVMRVVMEESRIGHAEFRIGAATFYLSDEFPEIGVVSPRTLGGSSVTLHLEVDDVDGLYARAVVAGAEAQAEPADQPHGARHGTLVDPFGHRWMLSQQVEQVSADVYGDRLSSYGMRLELTSAVHRPAAGGTWSSRRRSRGSSPTASCGGPKVGSSRRPRRTGPATCSRTGRSAATASM